MAGERDGVRSLLTRFRRAAPPPPSLDLERVRRRLELFVTAVHGQSIPIAMAELAGRERWLARFGQEPRHGRLAASDGARVYLPPRLGGAPPDELLARYRLLALEQATRVARGTAAALASNESPLVRDLYLLRESAAIDAAIAESVPGMRALLARERADALEARPAPREGSAVEREVERRLRELLASDPATPPPDLAPAPSPEASLAWARETAARLATVGRRYRGIAPVAAWGTVHGAAPPRPDLGVGLLRAFLPAVRSFVRIGLDTAGADARRGERRAMAAPEADRMHAHATGARAGAAPSADAEGVRPPEEPGASPDADSPRETREPGEPTESPSGTQAAGADVATLDAGGARGTTRTATRSDGRGVEARDEGIPYPEWDHAAERHRERAVRVYAVEAATGDLAWASAVLARHGAVVRQLRERFERMRRRRTRLSAQRDGDELDLAACVRALVERRTGQPVDDRLYTAVRPARRELAILLLVDVSGSTEQPVTPGERVIDVERAALLVTSEALDALGDRYAIVTFSGKSAMNVRVRTVKRFDERNGDPVRRRVAALAPEGYTRLGAAVRHATALLAREPVGHRLLLILSDGRPNDMDGYEERYAIEDSRQAIAESRAAGVYPFCLTIDWQGADYLAHVFGAAGHVILRDPTQLPTALVRVVRELVRG